LNTKVSQGSVATRLRCGESLNDLFIMQSLLSLLVKEFWKSANIWRRYGYSVLIVLLTPCPGAHLVTGFQRITSRHSPWSYEVLLSRWREFLLVLQGDPLEQMSNVRNLSHTAHSWLAGRRAKSFYTAVTAETLRLGVQSLLQV